MFPVYDRGLDHAISLLPAKIAGSSSDYGRIDQCFAKSWKAKTLLLKASPQFNPKRMYDNAILERGLRGG